MRELELERTIQEIENRDRRARARALVLTIIPLIVGVASITYAGFRVRVSMQNLVSINQEITKINQQKRDLETRVASLQETEATLLNFLAEVTAGQNIKFLD